jgi:hypothetical protein
MVSTVDADALADLRNEDPATALELHFEPLRVRALPNAGELGPDCSTDGYYDSITGATPTILFADDVSPARSRFTLLHELGHHLLAFDEAHLLDAIDQLATERTPQVQIEEKVCHEFAGRVLIPDDLLSDVTSDHRLSPSDIVDLYERCDASWEAVAVRAASACQYKAAVVLLRKTGFVSFCAASSRLTAQWWPRGSSVPADGPLARALLRPHRARNEIYRSGLAFAEPMYCDSLVVHDGLAVAVLTDKPSDGRFDILEEPEPAWKERQDFCERCNEERTDGWCDICRGRFCPECERCACSPLAKNPLCPGCGLLEPRRAGSTYCYTCEAGGLR